MTDDDIEAIGSLLGLCRHEKLWPRQRAEIERIEAKYKDQLLEYHSRKMLEAGWVLDGKGWRKAA